MMDWLPSIDDLKVTDYVSMALGLLGFLLGLIAIWAARRASKDSEKAVEQCDTAAKKWVDVEKRAIHAAEKAAENAIRQDRDEVFNLSLAAEAHILSLLRRVAAVRNDARVEGLESVQAAGGQLMAALDAKLAIMRSLLAETRKELPAKEEWPSLRRQLLEINAAASQLVDREALEKSTSDYLERSAERFRAARESRAPRKAVLKSANN